MDLKLVKQLADLMEERGLASIEMTEGDSHISLVKQAPAGAMAPPAMPPVMAMAPPPVQAAPAEPTPATPPAEEPGEALNAPLVGVAYLAPEPGAQPFVAAGQAVKKGQTLCIVEAMKVMNEFTAPRDGVVASVCVQDGQLVEHGQCLFRLQ